MSPAATNTPPVNADSNGWVLNSSGPGAGVGSGLTGCGVNRAVANCDPTDGLPAASVTAPGSTRAVTVPACVIPETVTTNVNELPPGVTVAAVGAAVPPTATSAAVN